MKKYRRYLFIYFFFQNSNNSITKEILLQPNSNSDITSENIENSPSSWILLCILFIFVDAHLTTFTHSWLANGSEITL